MKSTLIILLAFFALSLSATIIKVDNNVPSIGDYNNFADAYAAANSGDILYVYPSPTDYGTFYLAKPLTIIGGGFIPGNLSFPKTRIRIGLSTGAGGSTLIGLELYGDFSLYADNCTISNCRILSFLELRGSNTILKYNYMSTLYIQEDRTNNLVLGCYIKNGAVSLRSNTTTMFSGCIFENSVSEYANSHVSGPYYHLGDLVPVFSASFNNCVFTSNQTTNHKLFIDDNINESQPELSVYFSTAGAVFTNCIFNNMENFEKYAQFQYNILSGSFGYTGPSASTNLQNVPMSTVVTDIVNYDYHLCSGSQAIGTGIYGQDIGVYGGDAPFNDKWYITSLPMITVFESPYIVSPTGQLNVHVEAQSGN